jgi:CBS domain-containing protein
VTTERQVAMPPTSSTVSSIMTRTVYCVRPEVSVEMVTRLLRDHQVGAFPVVDARGRPIGILSKTDLIGAEDVAGATVGEVMIPIVFAVAHDAPIGEAAALMSGEEIHRVPVLDEADTVCGILSTMDIVRWLAELGGYTRR